MRRMENENNSLRSEPTMVTRDETTVPPHEESTLADVKQLGFWAALASLGYVFWVVGGMEMVERLAYYGVRAVATLYATRPASTGGLGVTMATFGTLLLFWNLTQSLIPIFTGGLSDRYGYKQTIFASTVIKCFGYLLMAWWPTY
jgi:dipeptide/tripeptide permease